MKLLCIATIMLFIGNSAFSQNFEPAPSQLQDKLENYLKRIGTIEKVYLADKDKKIFEAAPGDEYFAWFVFETKDKLTRRMMIVQQGPRGEKLKIHYPRTSQAFTDGINQAFGIEFIAPTEGTENTINYRVDASPQADVYLYKVTRGFKRDQQTGVQ